VGIAPDGRSGQIFTLHGEVIMDAGSLLQIAREIISKVPMCFAITVDQDGDANARIVQTSKLSDDWTVRFMTDRRSRKVEEIEQSARMTLAYQCDPEGAYVTLVGRATIIDDAEVKQAVWRPQSFRWHPGGPTDPNVVLIELFAERIEMWSSPHGIVPDADLGLWAAVLVRDASGWQQRVTARRSPLPS
jgi:general stress protein 26